MIKDFKDTKIPQIYSAGLYSEKGYDVAAEHAFKVLDIMVTGVTECLSDIKSKDFPVVFMFKQNNEEFIAAAIVQYFPNEDDMSQPGNWNYSWTFDKEDIPDNARMVYPSDNNMISYFRTTGTTKYGMVLEKADYASDIFRFLLATIKKWLDDNASETEVATVKYDGLIQFRVAVEDGEKVYSAEVDGEVKQIIKNDAAIEV